MSQKIAAKLLRSGLSTKAASFEPPDPLYETRQDPKTGKPKRSRRNIPPGLTKQEEKILIKIRTRAHYLDKGFSICGFRFGWTFLIGFIPGVGDVADALLSYLLVIKPAQKCNLPHLLLQRMIFNQILASTVGLIPIVGDIIMAIWKVNSRNAALFEDFLTTRGAHVVAGTADEPSPSETSALVQNSKRVTYIDGMSGERDAPPPDLQQPAQSSSTHPQPAPVPDKTPPGKTRKWFGK